MARRTVSIKWTGILIIIFYWCIFETNAQLSKRDNPHDLAKNTEICLNCHNKSVITTEEKKLLRIKDTHKFTLEAENCKQCHIFDSTVQETMPKFKKSIPELCTEPCHGKAYGLNHPVEVSPEYKVPDLLPLDNGEITCGTCHNPHSDPKRKIKTLLGWKEEKSYFLRVDNSHGELCRVCHPDYPVFE